MQNDASLTNCENFHTAPTSQDTESIDTATDSPLRPPSQDQACDVYSVNYANYPHVVYLSRAINGGKSKIMRHPQL